MFSQAIRDEKRVTLGLAFPKLNLDNIRIRRYADASFASNVNFSSQIVIIVLIVDDNLDAVIIHYSSRKCKRVTRSILVSELYALSKCFDYCSAIRHDLSEMLYRFSNIIIHRLTVFSRYQKIFLRRRKSSPHRKICASSNLC